MIRYIGRYIRHPAVAESRIEDYDGKEVRFWYEDYDGNKHYVTMNVEEFILAVIDHIPLISSSRSSVITVLIVVRRSVNTEDIFSRKV